MFTKQMTVEEITKKLISIPSFVGQNCDETKVADYIVGFLSPLGWKIEKQYIEKTRYKVVATKGKPKLWLGGHIYWNPLSV